MDNPIPQTDNNTNATFTDFSVFTPDQLQKMVDNLQTQIDTLQTQIDVIQPTLDVKLNQLAHPQQITP